ncbi:MAG: helix-turn-helix domain-containing protein [Pseudobdellovibrio sp.]
MNTEIKHNYYEILEIPQTATQQEIALAYEKAKRTYSVQNPALYAIFDKSEAQQLLNMIDEAFAVLANNTYRTIYEKRRQANTFSEEQLSVDSIKAASIELYNESKLKKDLTEIEEKNKSTYTVDQIMEDQIKNQKVWTGAFLKEVREYKKVSIELLNEKTKINTWYLKSLETMDLNNLPAPVFVRGYIIQVARCLNLDDKFVADSYMKLYKKAIEN